MTLEETINADIKTAMLSKNETALRTLRAIKSAILLAKTSGSTFSSEDEIKMLQKLVKQRKESADIYSHQNRTDLAQPELDEIAVIEKYLPKQLSREEILTELKQLMEKSGDAGQGNMGKLMGMASKHFAGRADNKVVSQLLKELLG